MAKRTCSLEGCDRKTKARGWCGKHYTRWQRHGDPLYVERIIGDPVARFWSRVDKAGPVPEHRPDLGPCWLWTGSLNACGYGTLGWGVDASQTWLAHRVAYTLEGGTIPGDREIDHLCRRPACVRPSHLEAVTHVENVRRGESASQQNARKTHCKRGHPFDEANTVRTRHGYRNCRVCKQDYMREYHQRERRRGR